MKESEALVTKSAVHLRRLIGSKEISPVELLEACIARIEAVNPAVNAIAATDFARARKLAARAEVDARNGEGDVFAEEAHLQTESSADVAGDGADLLHRDPELVGDDLSEQSVSTRADILRRARCSRGRTAAAA